MNKTVLAHILPAQSLFDGEHLIPLNDSNFFNRIFDSLAEWVATRKPGICLEHERNGESMGYVNRVIEDELGIFAELVLNEEASIRFEDDAFRFVSPTIAWNHRADDYGDKGAWDAALLEVSFVSVPRHSRQVPIEEMSSLAENTNQSVFYNETETVSYFSAYVDEADTYFITETNEGENEMDLDKLGEMMTGLLDERLAPLLARLDALESPKEEGEEEVKVEEEVEVKDDEKLEAEEVAGVTEEEKAEGEIEEEAKDLELSDKEDGEKSEMSEADVLNERIKELEKRSVMAEANVEKLNAEIAHRDAVLHVGGDIASRPHLSAMSERLVTIYKTDKNLYTEVLDVVPAGSASVLNERVTVGFAKADASLGNPYEAASKLSSDEGISYREAFTRLSK